MRIVRADRSLRRASKILASYIDHRRRYGWARPPGPILFDDMGVFRRAGSQGIISPAGSGDGIEFRLNPSEFRAELVPLTRHFHEDMFPPYETPLCYDFSLKLDESLLTNGATWCVAQWHGIPNVLLGGTDANPPVLFGIRAGRYFAVNVSSGRLVLPRRDPAAVFARYDRHEQVEFGSAREDVGRWVRWRLLVRWSFTGSAGFLRLFRNDQQMWSLAGPNCFNELRGGPYLQIGLYRLARERVAAARTPEARAQYRDIRISALV